MDTCLLERVERFRINLNEKNFASQTDTLTSVFPKDAEPLAPTAAATMGFSIYPLVPGCCEKGIEFGWHWQGPTQASLSGTPQKEHIS